MPAGLDFARALEALRRQLRGDSAARAGIARRRIGAIVELNRQIDSLASAVTLTEIYGGGALVAANILAEVGDPARFATKPSSPWPMAPPIEASSGRIVRHRLNRGGERSALLASWCASALRKPKNPRAGAGEPTAGVASGLLALHRLSAHLPVSALADGRAGRFDRAFRQRVPSQAGAWGPKPIGASASSAGVTTVTVTDTTPKSAARPTPGSTASVRKARLVLISFWCADLTLPG